MGVFWLFLKKEKILLFLKKKKQKDFCFLCGRRDAWVLVTARAEPDAGGDTRRSVKLRKDKSFFASFFSKKEESFLS
jgi:hypothetical protein